MRSLLGGVLSAIRPRAETPIPHASRASSYGYTLTSDRGDTLHQLRMMGQVGTLFGIVHRTTTSTAAVDWTLYRKAPSGKDEDRTPIERHAAIDLWAQPNPFYQRQGYVELVQQHVELTGRGFLILALVGKLPVEMWWARPDRMLPVPHPTKYLAGWVYLGPDGDRIPLSVQEVVPLRMPDPEDPYGGMGPVTALLADLESTRYSAEWNKMFFVNNAQPGGVVELPETLDDDEFRTFQTRWDEQHKGVSRAHRVALLEGGAKWVDRSVSQKDMEFVELRRNSRDTIMEAYTIHKAELGIAEDVNRANAEAGEVIFAKRLTVPRLERWKAALNGHILPMFGGTARGLEWDYESPVPEDAEAARAELLVRAQAAQAYASAGYPLAAIAEALELPEALQGVEEPAPPPVFPPGLPAPDEDDQDDEEKPVARRRPRRIRAAEDDPTRVDHEETQAAWERLVEQVLAEWGTVSAVQRAELLAQIETAVDGGDLAALSALSVDTDPAALLLARYLEEMAEQAADKVVDEAMRQGVDGVDPVVPQEGVLAELAGVTAAMIGAGMALAAGREAMRVQSAGMTGLQVADQVATYLVGLTPPRAELGGALTGAQNQARIETFRSGPVAALYADERMDANTCQNCREIDGRFLGLSSDGVTMPEVERMYPAGGYVDCLGRSRCRGTITGVWRK